MRHDQEDSSSKSEDVVLSVNSNKIDPVGLQNQVEGGSDPERAEFPEANPTEEAASVITGVQVAESCVDEGLKSEQGPTAEDEYEKSANPIDGAASLEIGAEAAESLVNPFDEAASVEMGAEAAESPVDEGVKSAQGLTTKHEEEKSTEVLEKNETSIAKEDSEPIILGQGSELPSLLGDASARATNVAQTEDHELPRGVLDDICAAEGTNYYSAAEADSSKAEQSLQLEASFTRLPIVVEENHQVVETQEVSDLPLDGYVSETQQTEKGVFSEKHGTEEEADNETGDAASEPNGHMFQQPIADKLDPSEAFDEGEESHENSGISDSATEKEMTGASEEGEESHENSGISDSATEKEMTGQLGQEGYMEQGAAAANMCSVEQGAIDTNHSPPKEGIDAGEGEGEGEMSRKLMEEKERLREMVAELIKAGHEQLTAISRLSGRVKDLEKKLYIKEEETQGETVKSSNSKFDTSGLLVQKRNWLCLYCVYCVFLVQVVYHISSVLCIIRTIEK